MQVYDLVVIAIAAALAFRGWRRGFIREVVEIAVLFIGTVIIFRMSATVGVVLSGMANISPEVARIVAGIVILVVLMVGSFFVSRIIAASMKIVPGATTLNRVGGAMMGIGYTFLFVVLATILLSAAPLPSSVRGQFDSSVEKSVIGAQIVSSDGIVQPWFAMVSGEEVFGAVISVRDAVGDRLMAGTLPVPIPGVGDAAIVPSQAAAQGVFDGLNAERISAGIDPVAWSPDLAIVAVARATGVYRSGFLRLDDNLDAALAAGGIPGTITGEMLVIAATPDGLIEAFGSVEAYEKMAVDSTFRKAGVGVVQGPYGLISVVVFSG
jgi:uncharacterized membrane protein required for colicin V production